MTPTEDYRRFPFHAGGSAMVRAAPAAVWSVVETIGGENRYFTLNGLWTLREQLDALVGGVGTEHVRPEARALRLGDRIDSWTVIGLDPPHRLALRFGMRAPGRGVLEFVIDPVGNGSRLTACAWWDPDGIAGRLYWIAMKPPHLILFDRLTAEIGRRAEASGTPGLSAPRTA